MSDNKQSEKMLAKILLCEDDKFISRAYYDGLTRAGFNVTAAYDGSEAMKLAKDLRPDIILLDLIMPEKNGFEVLAELKQDEQLKDIPVIILSNLGQETDIEKGKSLGAVDYLIKSDYSLAAVIEKIKSFIK